jgi:ATP-binding cassette subfamily C protein/ATP-binding cassette subfamily C protein LapB
LRAEVLKKLDHLSAEVDLSGEEFWARLHQAIGAAFRTPNDLSALTAPLLRRLGWRGTIREVIEALPYFADELDVTGLNNALAN